MNAPRPLPRRQLGLSLVELLVAITIGAIWLIPLVAQWAGGWRWVFLVLVPGPVFGAVAMLKLRQLPEATRMAGGLR